MIFLSPFLNVQQFQIFGFQTLASVEWRCIHTSYIFADVKKLNFVFPTCTFINWQDEWIYWKCLMMILIVWEKRPCGANWENFESHVKDLCGSCGSSLVSLEVFPQHKSCWSCRQLLYVTLFFIFPLFLCLFNLEFQNLLLSVPSVLSFSFLLTIFSIQLFSTLFSIPCSFFSLFIHFIFWSPLLFSFQICYPFFLFSYNYSVLPASPLCSIPIQSVLFLLVFILLDPSI